MLCFVLINSVPFNLLYVCICFRTLACSHACFGFVVVVCLFVLLLLFWGCCCCLLLFLLFRFVSS